MIDTMTCSMGFSVNSVTTNKNDENLITQINRQMTTDTEIFTSGIFV